MSDPGLASQHFPDFLTAGWRGMMFEPFRDGVEICWIRRNDPGLALLRYAPGASVPMHMHTGLETILVLEGSQSDERGTYRTGALVLNPEGSSHSVWSDEGCVVLIAWERPVRFLGAEG